MPEHDRLQLLTLSEAAEIARCSRATLRRRIGDGALRAIKHGRILRIDRRDLTAFLARQKRWH